MLRAISDRPDRSTPPMIKTAPTENSGTDPAAAAIAGYERCIGAHREQSDGRRALTAEYRIIELLRERLLKVAMTRGVTENELREMAMAVADRQRDPYSVVDEIIARLGISP